MKKVIYGLMGFALLMQSCGTKEDRDDMGPLLTKDQLKVAVIQPTAGSNTIVFHNQTVGVIMYYDWGTGTVNARKEYETSYIPVEGTHKVK